MDQSSDTKDNFTRFASNRLSAYIVQKDVQELFKDLEEEPNMAGYDLSKKKESNPEKQKPDTVTDYPDEKDSYLSIESIEIVPTLNCFKSVSCDIGKIMKREMGSMQNNLQKVKEKHAQLKSTANKKMVKTLKKVLS